MNIITNIVHTVRRVIVRPPIMHERPAEIVTREVIDYRVVTAPVQVQTYAPGGQRVVERRGAQVDRLA